MDAYPRLGQLSPDRFWAWNGQRWVPAVSHDGLLWWDGTRWTYAGWPLPPPKRRFPLPSWWSRWSVGRRFALGLWAVALVGQVAGSIAIAAVSRTLALVLLVCTPVVWSVVVGAAICPRGRWKDVPGALVAGILALLVAVLGVYVVAITTDECNSSTPPTSNCTDEHAPSLGMPVAMVAGSMLWAAMVPIGVVAAVGRDRMTWHRDREHS